MEYRASRLLPAIIFAVSAVTQAAAHPHVFIDVVMTVHLDEEGIAGIYQECSLFGMVPLELVKYYDVDRDGSFDTGEQACLYDTYFLPLWLINPFFILRVGGTEYSTFEIRDFRAEATNDGVKLAFSIPCAVRLPAGQTTVDIIDYDSTIYISFDMYNCIVDRDSAVFSDLSFVPDPDKISHGPDRCGTWASLTLDRTEGPETVQLANLTPILAAAAPQASVNPFYGQP